MLYTSARSLILRWPGFFAYSRPPHRRLLTHGGESGLGVRHEEHPSRREIDFLCRVRNEAPAVRVGSTRTADRPRDPLHRSWNRTLLECHCESSLSWRNGGWAGNAVG